MANGLRKQYTAEEWRQIIEAQRGSGQSQEAFCDTHGLGKSTFQAWKRRLYGAGKSLATPVAPPSFTPLFTPLTPQTPAASVGNGWTVELDLGGGLCLRLRQGA